MRLGRFMVRIRLCSFKPGAIMTSRKDFYRRWITLAFSGPVGRAQALEFMLFVIGGIWALADPSIERKFAVWLWAVPGAVFLATSIIAWWLAPYGMYRGLEEQLERHKDYDGKMLALCEVRD